MILVMVMQARKDKKGDEEVPISPLPTWDAAGRYRIADLMSE